MPGDLEREGQGAGEGEFACRSFLVSRGSAPERANQCAKGLKPGADAEAILMQQFPRSVVQADEIGVRVEFPADV